MTPIHARSSFARFATKSARLSGHPLAFFTAAVVILAWVATGPIFRFSDTWQLVINTTTTIVTFLMVFLIQNTQNRDSVATQIKLDELIRAFEGAHNALLDLEELDQAELDHIRRNYESLAAEARIALRKGLRDTGRPEIADDQR